MKEPRYTLLKYSKNTYDNGITYRMKITGTILETFKHDEIGEALVYYNRICLGNLDDYYIHQHRLSEENYGNIYILGDVEYYSFYNETAKTEFKIDGNVGLLDINLKLLYWDYTSFIREKVINEKNSLHLDIDSWYVSQTNQYIPSKDDINEMKL